MSVKILLQNLIWGCKIKLRDQFHQMSKTECINYIPNIPPSVFQSESRYFFYVYIKKGNNFWFIIYLAHILPYWNFASFIGQISNHEFIQHIQNIWVVFGHDYILEIRSNGFSNLCLLYLVLVESISQDDLSQRELVYLGVSITASQYKDWETHYRGEGFLFLTKYNKTQKELIYLFIF